MKKSELDINEIIIEYEKCGNLHKVAQKFSTSHIRISKLLKENNIFINNIGKKKDFSEEDINHMIDDYVINHMTMENISKKYSIRIKRLRNIFREKNVIISKWNGNAKKENLLNKRKEAFIKKAQIVHCDEQLDYSKVDYKNNRTHIIVIDHDLKEDGTEYGEYLVTPSNHLKGQSHPLKRGKKISNKKRFTNEQIIKMFLEKHMGENLDYSKVNYQGMDIPVTIICKELNEDGNEYGEFQQTPRIHLKGCSHPQLAIDKNSKNNLKTTEYFINRSTKVHDNTYDYSKSIYLGNNKPIEIICKKHGSFWMTPENHYYGKGCPKCGFHLSHKENEIYNFIKEKLTDVKQNDRKIINGKELDIYIPSKQIAIEYNGLRWHSEEFVKDKWYHLNKTLECNNKGIKLLQIFEDEYIEHKDIVLNKISHILGIQQELPNIMGRKCRIEIISKDIAEQFLNDYHIQGYARSTVYLGALYEDKLIAVMTFKQEFKNSLKWELTRFASDYHYVCQGVGGKMFKWFVKNYNPLEVKSFADRRWTLDKESNLYVKLGFELIEELKPEYRYYNPKVSKVKRFHKFGFRKQILNRKYGFPLSMTETEMVQALGYDRIWDCGLFKFVWKKEKSEEN